MQGKTDDARLYIWDAFVDGPVQGQRLGLFYTKDLAIAEILERYPEANVAKFCVQEQLVPRDTSDRIASLEQLALAKQESVPPLTSWTLADVQRITNLDLLHLVVFTAAQTLETVDRWLGHASTHNAAMDALWRLRRALWGIGLNGVRDDMDWRGSLIEALERAGFRAGEDGDIREVLPWQPGWQFGQGRSLSEVLAQLRSVAAAAEQLVEGRKRSQQMDETIVLSLDGVPEQDITLFRDFLEQTKHMSSVIMPLAERPLIEPIAVDIAHDGVWRQLEQSLRWLHDDSAIDQELGKTWETIKAETETAFASPQVGDRFHERYCFWVYILKIDEDERITTFEASGNPKRFPDAWKSDVREYPSVEQFRDRFRANRNSRDHGEYTVVLRDRGNDVSGWLDQLKQPQDGSTTK